MNSILEMLPSYILNFLLTTLLAIVVFLAGSFARHLWANAKKEYLELKMVLKGVDYKVTVATTNHLHTIQDNTGKTVEILEQMRLEQAELLGYLKGKE